MTQAATMEMNGTRPGLFGPRRAGSRLDFPRAWSAVQALMRDPDTTEHVFVIVEALRGTVLERTQWGMKRDAVGRSLLSDKPDLVAALQDRDALRAMPEGSLGRAYLAFVEAEGISADGLNEADVRSKEDLDDDLAFVLDWLRDTHDLKHALTGYRGDLVGEVSLLAFDLAQHPSFGLLLIVGMGTLQLSKRARHIERRAPLIALQAYLRGHRAKMLLNIDYVAALGRPLDEVRTEMGLGTPPIYRDVRSDNVVLMD